MSSTTVPCCAICLAAVMPTQQGACPHCGRELPEYGPFTRNRGDVPCRCLVLGVQPGELPHEACGVHGDLEQLKAAERTVLAAIDAQP